MTYQSDILQACGYLAQCDMPADTSAVFLKMFAANLIRFRQEAGFRFAQPFAEKIGIHPHTYRKFERANKFPEVDELAAICMGLGKTPNDLMPWLADIHKKAKA
jgi:transcriptional regulator with XRE-family HTH domain